MPQPVIKAVPPVTLAPLSWAADDSGIIVSRSANGKQHLLFVPLARNGEAGPPRDLLGTAYNESGARFSPRQQTGRVRFRRDGKQQGLRGALRRGRESGFSRSRFNRGSWLIGSGLGGGQLAAFLHQQPGEGDVRND